LTGTGTPAPQHSVNLSWTASTSPNITGYNIYRGVKSGGPYSKINSVLIASTVYSDTPVVDGLTYYYVTTAVDSNNQESAYSNQTQAVIPPP
jgi:fibronectin type 3 domain-containing protein